MRLFFIIIMPFQGSQVIVSALDMRSDWRSEMVEAGGGGYE